MWMIHHIFYCPHLQLYRHGDRTPVGRYKNDPYNETSWPVPYGQLTNVSKDILQFAVSKI